MKNVLKSMAKLVIALVLGIIYMWFVLIFKWSIDEMSLLERIIGIVYIFAMMPLYYGIKRLFRLD